MIGPRYCYLTAQATAPKLGSLKPIMNKDHNDSRPFGTYGLSPMSAAHFLAHNFAGSVRDGLKLGLGAAYAKLLGVHITIVEPAWIQIQQDNQKLTHLLQLNYDADDKAVSASYVPDVRFSRTACNRCLLLLTNAPWRPRHGPESDGW